MTAALFDLAPLVTPEPDRTLTTQERYEAWIAANPWVLDVAERLAARYLAAGRKRIGAKQIWEVIRYEYGATTGDPFKANNNFTSRVARDLIARHPEWSDAIETRVLRAA